MSQGTLFTHCGAEAVTRDELALIPAPPATETWFPIKHGEVLDAVEGTLEGSGLAVAKTQLSVARDNKRFFGVLDLRSPISEGVCLSVGIRNSCDKSFPIGFCCGSRVFCCDNLAFSAEIVIAKRHTRFGRDRFNEGIANAVATLHQFRDLESQRIETMRSRQLTDDRANSLILQAGEKVVGWRAVPKILQEWREPSHEEFRPRTAYSLLNCFTEVLRPRFEKHPNRAAYETIELQQLLAV